jgi:Undecaprenyl-phosphate glucose phosphotransferase
MTQRDLATVETASTPPEALGHVAKGLRRPSLAPVTVAMVSATTDAVVFCLALWFGLFAAAEVRNFDGSAALLQAGGGSFGAVALLALVGSYQPRALGRRWQATGLAVAAVSLGAALASAVLGGAPEELWRQLAVAVPVAAIARQIISGAVLWLRDCGLMERRAVLAGGGLPAADLMKELAARPDNDIRVVAIFDDRGGDRSEPMVLGVPKIGRFGDLDGFCRQAEVELIIVTLPLSAEDRLAGLMRRLRVLPLPVYLSGISRDRQFRGHRPLPDAPRARLIQALPASYLPGRRLAKRSFDLVFACFALAVLWPVFLATALAIRIESPGPVFFRQRRHGYNHREITVLKFRSMFHDRADPEARQVVTRDDGRVTRVGRVLRRTSLDELPQLLNVLAGSLSLVGPRPHALVARSSRDRAFAEMVEDYSARHRLPPGITGLAQISGWRGEVRDDEDLQQRIACDLSYIENWSLWLDLWILIRTPISLLRPKGAY